MDVDALIVGGGPIGLMLALGLHSKGLKVCVLERSRKVSEDWSSAYSYRIDCRGIEAFAQVGLLPKLEAVGVPSQGFFSSAWKPDGTFKSRSSNAAISLGYWIQRPALLKLLEDALPEGCLVEGTLKTLRFEGHAIADVTSGNDLRSIRSWLVFGCDGTHSEVRTTLSAHSDEFAADFTPRVLKTPSSGLVYKAVLFTPPDDFDPQKIYRILGKSGRSFALLPFAGKAGEPRPLSFAQAPEHIFHSFKYPADLFTYLDEDFPQIEARKRLLPGSASALCSSGGSVFPHARWCTRASAWIGSIGVALLGDSLHCFPPDLGQGVNAGLSDLTCLLSLWPSDTTDRVLIQQCLKSYSELQAPEAEAICKLLPIGMPYQYNLPNSCAKYSFFANFLCRMLAWKLAPAIFDAPVVFQVTQAPPVKYTEIHRRHQRNTRMLLATFATCSSVSLAVLTFCRRSYRQSK